MGEASISVDIFNPGQVFACLGFLEVADLLLGSAEGGFDWSNEAKVRFRLLSRDIDNPFAVVLDAVAASEVRRYAPRGYVDPPPNGKGPVAAGGDDDETPVNDPPEPSKTFPGPKADGRALPIRLIRGPAGAAGPVIEMSHWVDGSTRSDFKLYAGNRSAATIARAMLCGTRAKSKTGQRAEDVRTLGLRALWGQQRAEFLVDPFGVLTPMGGSFNFDPRGAWTGIDAGYSPNDQGHRLAASPVVELLAAVGLEHARPKEYENRKVRYSVWGCLLPPLLARPVLGGASLAVPRRVFSFELALSGKNKNVTFAQEEMQG